MSEHDPRHAAERAGRGALEAILMVVDEPVSDVVLATALELTVNEVRATLVRLAADYDENGRGFTLRQVAGGWRGSNRVARTISRSSRESSISPDLRG